MDRIRCSSMWILSGRSDHVCGSSYQGK
jgi:hypothetical protein